MLAEYLPPMQSIHSMDPRKSVYFPSRHCEQYAASPAPIVAEYFPGRQSTHMSSELCPSRGKYLPAPQSMHMSKRLFEYLPTPHIWQATVAGVTATLPASQVLQADGKVAAIDSENFPVAQSVHTSDPAPEYLPATQSEHRVLSVLENVPAAHCTHVVDPGNIETDPILQILQDDAESAAISVEYLPAAHLVQPTDPGMSEYLPATQFAQKFLEGVEYFPTPHVSQWDAPDKPEAVPSAQCSHVVS